MASEHPQPTSRENETLCEELCSFCRVGERSRNTPTRTMISYDMSALFTSIPTCEAKKVIRDRLKDKTLPTRCELNVDQLVTLLELCLETTYFMLEGKFYRHLHMGQPWGWGHWYHQLWPTCTWKILRRKHCQQQPLLQTWLRYVDNTFTVLVCPSKIWCLRVHRTHQQHR